MKTATTSRQTRKGAGGASPQKMPLLLLMPQEILVLILSYLYVESPDATLVLGSWHGLTSQKFHFSALLRACRHLYKQLTPEVYKRVYLDSPFTGNDPPNDKVLRQATSRIPGLAKTMLQWLKSIGPNTQHLQHVEVTLPLLLESHVSQCNYSMSHEELLECVRAEGDQFGYERVFEFLKNNCPALESIKIKLSSAGYKFDSVHGKKDQLMRRIAELRVDELLDGSMRFHYLQQVEIKVERKHLGHLTPIMLRDRLGLHMECRLPTGNDPSHLYTLTNCLWQHASAFPEARRILGAAGGQALVTTRSMARPEVDRIIVMRNEFMREWRTNRVRLRQA